MIIRFKSILVWLIIIVQGSMAIANNPIPTDKPNDHLFTIERSRDADVIIYELNFDENGEIIKSNPIKIYWLRNANHQKVEPLSFIQQQYAYGIKFLDQERKTENEWRFQFVSYSKRTFVLKQADHSRFKVFTEIENQEVELNRIYILFENRNFWFPSISAVELHGEIATSGKLLAEVIIP